MKDASWKTPTPGLTYKRRFTNGMVVPITVTAVDGDEVIYRSSGCMPGSLSRKMWDIKVYDGDIELAVEESPAKRPSKVRGREESDSGEAE